MFQKSLLKNFTKSFNIPNYTNIIKITTKDKFIAEDANGVEFIMLLSQMLKKKIAKYNKHFDSLNTVDKIEIKEEIEKLERLVLNNVNEIDSLVYGFYWLSGYEVKLV